MKIKIQNNIKRKKNKKLGNSSDFSNYSREQLEKERFPSWLRKDLSNRKYYNIALTIFSFICYCIACFITVYTVQQIMNTSRIQQEVAENIIKQSAQWPSADKVKYYHSAEQYNTKIKNHEIPVIGDVINPATGKLFEDEDTTYQHALNLNNSSAIGVVKIPKISVELTVYHGTTSSLVLGVGHVYGTALPIGQKGSLSAISGHSGSVSSMIFTRLPEIQKDDFVYMNVLGKEYGYKVITTEIINPEKMGERIKHYSTYAIKHNKSLLWLNCCWPIGVNTQRFVAVAEKMAIPSPIPPSYKSQKDNTFIASCFIVAIFIIILILHIVYKIIRRRMNLRKRWKTLESAGYKKQDN